MKMQGVCQKNWVMEIFILGLIWDTLEGTVMMNYINTWSVSWSKKVMTNTLKLCVLIACHTFLIHPYQALPQLWSLEVSLV
jgi:hypothetical protein